MAGPQPGVPMGLRRLRGACSPVPFPGPIPHRLRPRSAAGLFLPGSGSRPAGEAAPALIYLQTCSVASQEGPSGAGTGIEALLAGLEQPSGAGSGHGAAHCPRHLRAARGEHRGWGSAWRQHRARAGEAWERAELSCVCCVTRSRGSVLVCLNLSQVSLCTGMFGPAGARRRPLAARSALAEGLQ